MKHIPGEVKTITVVRSFDWQGRRYNKGETFECRAAEALELMTVPRPRKINPADYTAIEMLSLGQPPVSVTGGAFTLSRRDDGFHEISFWQWAGRPHGFSESERFVCVTFLKPWPFALVEKGDKRRIRLPIALEMDHKWRNTGKSLERGVSYATPAPDPVLQIEEDKYRPLTYDEKRAKAIAEGIGNHPAFR